MPQRKRNKECLNREAAKCQKLDGFFVRPRSSSQPAPTPATTTPQTSTTTTSHTPAISTPQSTITTTSQTRATTTHQTATTTTSQTVVTSTPITTTSQTRATPTPQTPTNTTYQTPVITTPQAPVISTRDTRVTEPSQTSVTTHQTLQTPVVLSQTSVTTSAQTPLVISHPSDDDTLNTDIGKIFQISENPSNLSYVSKSSGIVENMSDERKYRILREHFEPDSSYTFPVTYQHQCNRKCKLEYLTNNFKYSQHSNAVYCLPCALFVPEHKRKKLQSFVNKGYGKWSNVKAKELEHSENDYHKQAVFDAENCIAKYEKPDGTLPYMVTKELSARKEKYGVILTRIAQAVHFCGRQGIALRGRGNEVVSETQSHANPGNFLAVLREFAKDDAILKEHLECPIMKNATYLRHDSQNEMIHVIGHNIIQASIIQEIKDAGYHTIMVDEVTSQIQEVMSLCFRFVDGNKMIREEFIDFIEVDHITGEALSKKILDFYDRHGLDIQQLRSQCYDGAANMSGAKKGVAARILEINPQAPYVHCNSHILNLSIAASCKDIIIQHVIATTKAIAIFYRYSPKREHLLNSVVAQNNVHPSTRSVIKDMCKTRWTERDGAYEHFYLAFPFIVESLEVMNGTHSESATTYADQKFDPETKRDATAFLKSLCDFGFIVGLISLYHFLHPLHGVTVKLQGKNVDILAAYAEVESTILDLQEVRSEIDDNFGKVLKQAIRIGKDVGVEPSLPRTVSRQIHRQNTPASTPEEYYRRTVAIPLIDCIISEMTTRFDAYSQKAIKLIGLVPSILCDTGSDVDVDEVVEDAVDMFKHDITHPQLVHLEITAWRRKWTNVAENDRPDSLSKSIIQCDTLRYPIICKLLTIACTFGVTSCECERSFSTMRRLKSYLRSTMATDRLSALAQMNIHYAHKVDYNEAVKLFMELHPRRIHDVSLIYSS